MGPCGRTHDIRFINETFPLRLRSSLGQCSRRLPWRQSVRSRADRAPDGPSWMAPRREHLRLYASVLVALYTDALFTPPIFNRGYPLGACHHHSGRRFASPPSKRSGAPHMWPATFRSQHLARNSSFPSPSLDTSFRTIQRGAPGRMRWVAILFLSRTFFDSRRAPISYHSQASTLCSSLYSAAVCALGFQGRVAERGVLFFIPLGLLTTAYVWSHSFLVLLLPCMFHVARLERNGDRLVLALSLVLATWGILEICYVYPLAPYSVILPLTALLVGLRALRAPSGAPTRGR
jgi:hypothetical protein